jgi:hypothetical protein
LQKSRDTKKRNQKETGQIAEGKTQGKTGKKEKTVDLQHPSNPTTTSHQSVIRAAAGLAFSRPAGFSISGSTATARNGKVSCRLYRPGVSGKGSVLFRFFFACMSSNLGRLKFPMNIPVPPRIYPE